MTQLQPAAGGRWLVVYLDHASGQTQMISADNVVIATGMYSLANVPVYQVRALYKY
jgi:cation diffusion facilitator CzcD-associated flavoprotein CzcO